MTTMTTTRQESDLLGSRDVPADALYGVHTVRAMENFPVSGRRVHGRLVHAYGMVKLACAGPTGNSAPGTRPASPPWNKPARR